MEVMCEKVRRSYFEEIFQVDKSISIMLTNFAKVARFERLEAASILCLPYFD